MYFRFIPTEFFEKTKSNSRLRQLCRRVESLEDLLLFWVVEERYFTINKRRDDISGKLLVALEFFDGELMIGQATTAMDSFLKSSSKQSSLAEQVVRLEEETLECYSGVQWFRRTEREA